MSLSSYLILDIETVVDPAQNKIEVIIMGLDQKV